jgi:hypothetical protein
MAEVWNEDGSEKADIPLSEKQLSLLAHDGTVTVIFHTPQLLRTMIAVDNGSFEVSKKGGKKGGVLVASDWTMVKRFLLMLDNVAKAQNA